MKTTDLKRIIIENYIDHVVHDLEQNDKKKDKAYEYVDEDHVDEVLQSTQTFAILRKKESENEIVKHGKLYHYQYLNNNEDFEVYLDGNWHSEVSTAFDFLTVN